VTHSITLEARQARTTVRKTQNGYDAGDVLVCQDDEYGREEQVGVPCTSSDLDFAILYWTWAKIRRIFYILTSFSLLTRLLSIASLKSLNIIGFNSDIAAIKLLPGGLRKHAKSDERSKGYSRKLKKSGAHHMLPSYCSGEPTLGLATETKGRKQ
jgi:hypothetical protein